MRSHGSRTTHYILLVARLDEPHDWSTSEYVPGPWDPRGYAKGAMYLNKRLIFKIFLNYDSIRDFSLRRLFKNRTVETCLISVTVCPTKSILLRSSRE